MFSLIFHLASALFLSSQKGWKMPPKYLYHCCEWLSHLKCYPSRPRASRNSLSDLVSALNHKALNQYCVFSLTPHTKKFNIFFLSWVKFWLSSVDKVASWCLSMSEFSWVYTMDNSISLLALICLTICAYTELINNFCTFFTVVSWAYLTVTEPFCRV